MKQFHSAQFIQEDAEEETNDINNDERNESSDDSSDYSSGEEDCIMDEDDEYLNEEYIVVEKKGETLEMMLRDWEQIVYNEEFAAAETEGMETDDSQVSCGGTVTIDNYLNNLMGFGGGDRGSSGSDNSADPSITDKMGGLENDYPQAKVSSTEKIKNGKREINIRISNTQKEGENCQSMNLNDILANNEDLGIEVLSLIEDMRLDGIEDATCCASGRGGKKNSKKSQNRLSKISKDLADFMEFGIGGDDGDSGPGSGGSDNNVDPAITFEKIGGLESHIAYLKENVIFPLEDPQALKNFCGKNPPRGIMFYGVPGSGKTLLATALSNELSRYLKKKVSFFYRKGPDTFNMYFGETNKNLTKLFTEAAMSKPSVIFFDEIDGLCPTRDGSSSNGEAYNTVVTTLLGLMDNVTRGEVFVIAATNRLESVDPAMLRPGRFDKKLVFHPPDEQARRRIIEINLENWDSSERPSAEIIERIAKETTGFTGADLEKLCRDAFLKAFDRHIPDMNINSNISGLKVQPEDWFSAIKGMTRTNALSFGSFLYVPSTIQHEVLPLLTSPSSQILEDLKNQAPLKRTQVGSSSTGISSSYFISDYGEDNGYATDNLLVSHILSDRALAKFPTYIISEETITTNQNYANAIEQAVNSASCILLIHRLDYLIGAYPGKCAGIAKQLGQLKGKPCLVLATASCEPHNLHIQEFRSLFTNGKSRKVGHPSEAERRNYFRQIFEVQAFHLDNTTAKTAQIKKKHGAKMEKLFEFCVGHTRSNSVTRLMNLYAELSLACLKYSDKADKTQLENELDTILHKHASST